MKVFIEDCFLNSFLILFLVCMLLCYLIGLKNTKKRFFMTLGFMTPLYVFINSFCLPTKIEVIVFVLFSSITILTLIRKTNFKKYILYLTCFLLIYLLVIKLCETLSKLFSIKFNLHYFDSTKIILLVLLFSFVLLKIIQSLKQQSKVNKFVYDVEIMLKNKRIRLKGFLDTGNMLVDNVSGKPVVIISYSILNSLLPKIKLEDLILNKIGKDFGYYINYSTVGNSGKMFVFKPDMTIVLSGKNKEKIDVVLGLSLKGFGDDANFSALLNPLAIRL